MPEFELLMPTRIYPQSKLKIFLGGALPTGVISEMKEHHRGKPGVGFRRTWWMLKHRTCRIWFIRMAQTPPSAVFDIAKVRDRAMPHHRIRPPLTGWRTIIVDPWTRGTFKTGFCARKHHWQRLVITAGMSSAKATGSTKEMTTHQRRFIRNQRLPVSWQKSLW